MYTKDFNRLMFNKNKNKNKKYFCKSCLQYFSSENVLLEHKKDCSLINGGQDRKLEKGFIEFKNFNRHIPVPFKIYADFKCLLKGCDVGLDNDCFSYTRKYQYHIPCGFAYKLVCVDNKSNKDIVLYRGKNAAYKFIKCIFKEYGYCRNVMKKHFNKNLVVTAEENEKCERSNICWVCGKLIEFNDKVGDLCHISGKSGGSSYWSSNINLKISRKLPVIFHNLRGYDSHLIFKELSKFDCKISVIPNGLEKCMSFTLNNNIVFIDSMLFMSSSLDKLAKNLSNEYFKYLNEEFSDEKLKLVKKKGIYPYEYFGSFKKIKEANLPDIDKPFSSLKDCGISEKEYQRACDVWRVFEVQNLGQYHDLYLKTDVLILCYIFEKFISVCLRDYGLDCCHYFSSPSLSWDAMLKFTGVKLEKIHDISVHLFLEKGIRGGVSYISKRYSKADQDAEIMYWDMNNLCGSSMILDLSYSSFMKSDLDSIAENSPIGYILKVDLEHCKELHDLHSDYPLCPEKIEVSYDMLSKYCKDIADCYEIKVGGVKKLIPNLGDKVKYVVHYESLKYYISLGMKLVRIHRILKFKQSNWLQSYADFNTKKRQESLGEICKLLNSCIYGKSIENIRKRINVKLINDKKTYQKIVNKPNFI